MKRNLLIASVVALLLTTNVLSQKVSNIGVKASFAFCGAGDTICETANRVRQDTVNSYEDTKEGVSAVLVSGSKDITINLVNSTRTVLFDFSEVAQWSGVPSWWYDHSRRNVKPHFNVIQGYSAKGACGYVNSTPVYPCSIETNMNAGSWKVNTTTYTLQWHPGSAAAVNSSYTTSKVKVVYDRDSLGEVYTVTPLPSVSSSEGKVIAGMATTVNRVSTNAGQYVMPFTLVIRPR